MNDDLASMILQLNTTLARLLPPASPAPARAKKSSARKRQKKPAQKKAYPIPYVPDWTKVKQTCPRCGLHAAIDPAFGVRDVRGVPKRQSYCKGCRSKLAYASRQRVYRTKNNPT